MNTEDAKIILASVRRDADQNSDGEVGEAFALLGSDQELEAWFEREQAFDSAVARKLAQIEPPADLKASLLGLLEKNTRSVIVRKKATWLRPPLLAAAAAIILLPLLAVQLLTGPASAKSFDSFRSDMVEIARGEFALDHHEKDLDKLYAWLNKVEATCPTSLPVCVECTESIGCKVIDWNEDSVTLICLRNNSSQVVHCFVIPRKEFKKLPAEKVIRRGFLMDGLETCAWSDKDFVYLLVGSEKGVKVNAPEL